MTKIICESWIHSRAAVTTGKNKLVFKLALIGIFIQAVNRLKIEKKKVFQHAKSAHIVSPSAAAVPSKT